MNTTQTREHWYVVQHLGPDDFATQDNPLKLCLVKAQEEGDAIRKAPHPDVVGGGSSISPIKEPTVDASGKGDWFWVRYYAKSDTKRQHTLVSKVVQATSADTAMSMVPPPDNAHARVHKLELVGDSPGSES